MTSHTRYDVVVVGARAAGAATAMLLARQGLSVLAVDRAPYGSDTLSTHALMRAGVLQLVRWGLLPAVRAAGTPPVHRVTFHYPDETLPIDVTPADGVDALYAPRRTVLDRILVDAAREAGAEVRFGVRIDGVTTDTLGRVTGVRGRDEDGTAISLPARLTIGADGMRSTIARAVGAPVTRQGRHATAVVYGHFTGIATTGYEWAYSPSGGAGLIPTNDGAVCVFAGTTPDRFRTGVVGRLAEGFREILADVNPEMAARVDDGRPVSRLRGFPGLPGSLRRPWGPGWALVGDAGYFKDPITAHGISDALRDAELLARATVDALTRPDGESEALAGYESTRDAVSVDLFEKAEAVAAWDWDLARGKVLVKEMGRAMREEQLLLAELDRVAAA